MSRDIMDDCVNEQQEEIERLKKEHQDSLSIQNRSMQRQINEKSKEIERLKIKVIEAAIEISSWITVVEKKNGEIERLKREREETLNWLESKTNGWDDLCDCSTEFTHYEDCKTRKIREYLWGEKDE